MREEVENAKRGTLCFGGKSLSAAFTQTRLFWPDGVILRFLLLTYLSTAALKNRILPCQAEKCVFCKFAQHLPSPSHRSGEFREGDAKTCF